MIALAIAWAVIGAITFAGILLEYIEDRLRIDCPCLSAQDALGIPASLAILLLAWPAAFLMEWYRERQPEVFFWNYSPATDS